jgi:Cu-processing system permease protein
LVIALSVGGGNVWGFVGLVGMILLLGAATLSIGTALAVLARGRARVIGGVFAVWLLLVYVSDLGTIGLSIARNLQPVQIFVLALLNPVQQARVLGTLALSTRLDVLGPVGLFGLDHFGHTGLALMLACGLLATAVAPLAFGYVLFRRTPVT